MKLHPIFYKPYNKWWILMAIFSLINYTFFGLPKMYENKDYGIFFYTFTALLFGLLYGSVLYLIYWLIKRKWNNKIYIILISIAWLFNILQQKNYDEILNKEQHTNIQFKDYSSLNIELNKNDYYHSKINNFRVQIPENWSLNKRQVLGIEISFLSPTENTDFSVQICNLNGEIMDIDNIPDSFVLQLQDKKRTNEMKIIDSNFTTIANQKTKFTSVKLSYNHLKEKLTFYIESYIFIYDNRVYHLVFRSTNANNNYKQDYKTILNSFMLEYYK